ncbi:MAG TPA: carbonic anhydrase [Acidimicrobiia bacterium]|jgi:carbonic anhydrase|nr:carbonic anhydrase [Acidimicrobiia bacterium]
MDLVDELLRRTEPQGHFGVPAPPRLGVAIVTCMDARIDPVRMFGLEPGDAHVLRNAGGVVTDDVIRSLMLSQRILGTRAVMLIHHTRCGAHGLQESQVKAQLQSEVGMHPPFALEGFADLEAAVRQSMARVRHSPFLAHRDNVRGFVLDVDDGRLREVV